MDKAMLLQAIDMLKAKIDAAPDIAATVAALQKFGDTVALSTIRDEVAFNDGTSRFLVRSDVFVWARSARDAAIEARHNQRRPSTMGAIFRVVDRDANATVVDLTSATIPQQDQTKVLQLGVVK